MGLAQLTVDDAMPVEDIVKQLEGDGVRIENITYYFPLENDSLKSPVAFFEDDVATLGMERGLLMTNGAAVNALGPNDLSDKAQANYYDVFEDDDLGALINDEQTLQDLTIIEFDITVYGDFLSFNYVFASEEYPEFLDFNDAFGFFISGPNINGVENIALVPGTNIPVSVSNINQNNNNQYFISNGTGDTPFDNPQTQYDGYTTILRAERRVIPCETYHIKLAIADVNDSNLDSGVFLEEGSFRTAQLPHFKIQYEHPRFPYLVEGCNAAHLIIQGSADIQEEETYDLLIEGTATHGEDYDSIPLQITLSPSQLVTGFDIIPVLDSIEDAYETLKITLLSNCEKFPILDEIEIPLREKFSMTLKTIEKCGPGDVLLNENTITTDYYFWNPHTTLSCFECPSPTTNTLENTTFSFEVYDSISTCHGEGTQTVKYENIVSDFDAIFDECKTTIDVDFVNKSIGADKYVWNFGDEKYSHQKDVSHTYKVALNKQEPQSYWVSLTVVNSETQCRNTKWYEININEPLFAPNIITPNDDGENDIFTIKGINEICWNFEVYNRWGKLVFQESPFKNRFSPVDLTDGIYYYYIKNEAGDKSYNGTFNVFK